ncbi:MAG: serine protease [Acetobacteraceae bacterium]|nr:serine protease [Acetobacteraceae bacterium]
MSDALKSFSAALASLARAASSGLVTLYPGERAQRSAFLWQPGILVTSEQGLPDGSEVSAILPGGGKAAATVAGRDPGTNVAALRIELTGSPRPASGQPELGGLALALGAAEGTPTLRLGAVHRVGPAWDSLANGRIDQLIHLDIRLEARDEGGPVLDASGALLGMSTLGPRRRVLVIPAATVERVVPQLLAGGRVQQGWLGLGLQPVGIPANLRGAAGREAGLMVVSLAAGGPAEQAGVLPGDILLEVAGEAAPHPRAVARALAGEQVGKVIPLRLLRAGAPVDLQATVALRPAA